MSDEQLTQYIADAVKALLNNENFLHYGQDKLGISVVFIILSVCRDVPFQNDSHFNHPSYHGILDKYFWGKNGIAAAYPHQFGPMFPIPGMAITAAMVSPGAYHRQAQDW